jgi:hypothetical protein
MKIHYASIILLLIGINLKAGSFEGFIASGGPIYASLGAFFVCAIVHKRFPNFHPEVPIIGNKGLGYLGCASLLGWAGYKWYQNRNKKELKPYKKNISLFIKGDVAKKLITSSVQVEELGI